MKHITLIDSISNFNDNLNNVCKEDYYLFKSKFDRILFLYFYFLNILFKIYFSRKIYKLLKRLTSLRFRKIFFLNKYSRKKIKKKLKLRRKRILFVSRMILKFYRKKIIFFNDYIKKYHRVLNFKKNNSYTNFFYKIFSIKKSNILTTKRYSKDKFLDHLNDYFNFDKDIISKFLKFKIKKLKNNQLIRVIYLLKRKFNWKLINSFKVISSLKPFNKNINNYLYFYGSYSLDYLQALKPITLFYIKFILKNKINFLLKKKIIKFLFFFNKKLYIEKMYS